MNRRSVAPTQDYAEQLLQQLEDVIVYLDDVARSDVGNALSRLARIARAGHPREMANMIERPYGARRPSIVNPWVFETTGRTSADF